jgi:acylphosphatase
MKTCAHVFISGIVQGVYFRAHTRDEARQAGVKGWVKNLPDGRVEALFIGDNDAVGKMLMWVSHGPPGAEVTDVESKWEEPGEEFNSFEIITW